MAEWRDIKGFPDYQVSDDGQVRSSKRTWTNRVLMPRSQGEYLQVRLYSPEYRRGINQYVHRLVLEAFVGSGEGKDSHHDNGIPFDNNLSNLKWEGHAEHGAMSVAKRDEGRELATGHCNC